MERRAAVVGPNRFMGLMGDGVSPLHWDIRSRSKRSIRGPKEFLQQAERTLTSPGQPRAHPWFRCDAAGLGAPPHGAESGNVEEVGRGNAWGELARVAGSASAHCARRV